MAVVDSTRTVTEILDRVLAGERLSDADALTLMQSRDLVSIGAAANEIRNRKANPGEVTYIVDRNINYTNVCVADCGFCAFYRRPKDNEGWTLSYEQIGAKIDEVKALGGVNAVKRAELEELKALSFLPDAVADAVYAKFHPDTASTAPASPPSGDL